MNNTTRASERAVSIFAVVLLLGIGAVGASYIQTAFGWTNPPAAPPAGSGAITAVSNNVGINYTTPTSSLVVNGMVDVLGNRIQNVATPVNGGDAVNKDYVDAATSTAGGSVFTMYYQTDDSAPAPTPSCPTDYELVYEGYGPHYLGIYNYDWTEGGTGGGFPVPEGSEPPPGANSSYTLNSIAIGSDSVCSYNETTTVPFGTMYLNYLQYDSDDQYASACAVTEGGATVCNRCKVCAR